MSAFLVLACADTPLGTLGPTRIGAPARLVDIDSTAPGYFLPESSPEQCWWGSNPDVQTHDADWDWVDDRCEFTIAQAFAPQMRFHSGNERCPGWQPYWAAKGFGNGSRMRIAYMMAYYDDCGDFKSHNGDSEMVTVQIIFDPATNHWMLESVWTSAHYQSGGFDGSHWNSWPDMQNPDRTRGRPRVWVAPTKHANYASLSGCIGGEFANSSHCNGSYIWDRDFPVHLERNAGSRDVDRLGCVFANDPPNAGSGRCERFYALQVQHKFNGWFPAPDGEGGGGRYHDMLVSRKFEIILNPNGSEDWGPDRFSPPPPQTLPGWYVNIVGVSQIGAQVGCGWSANVTGATPISYSWTVNGQPMGVDAANFDYTNTGSDFELAVEVTVESGARGTGFHSVMIVEGEWCT